MTQKIINKWAQEFTNVNNMNSNFTELYNNKDIATTAPVSFLFSNSTTSTVLGTSASLSDNSFNPVYFSITAGSGTTDTAVAIEAATNSLLTNWVKLGQAFFSTAGSAKFLSELPYYGYRTKINRIAGGVVSCTLNRGVFDQESGFVITNPRLTGIPTLNQPSRTVALIGDSRTVQGLTVSATGRVFNDRGYLGWAIAAAGCHVPIVANSSAVGRKIGPMYDLMSTEVFPFEPTDIFSFGFVNSIEDWPVSTSAEIKAAAAGIFAGLKLQYDEIIRRGIFLHLISECANTSLTTNQKYVIPAVVALQQQYCAERPTSTYFTNLYKVSVDPTSSVGNFIPSHTDDLIHFTQYGAWVAGNTFAPSIASRLTPVLQAMSQTDSRTVNVASNQLVVNPLMTGTAGTISTAGITGTVPTGFTVSHLGSGGAGFAADSTVVSIVPASDGIGSAIRIAVNCSGVRRITIKSSNVLSLFTVGKGLYATGRIRNTVVGQLKNYSIGFKIDTGSGVSQSGLDTGHSLIPIPSTFNLPMISPVAYPVSPIVLELSVFLEIAAADTTSVIIIEGLSFREI